MKNERLNTKYLKAIEDEQERYIFVTITKGNDYAKDRNKLAIELGISKRAVTSKYHNAARVVIDAIRKAEEEEFDKKVKACYDSDGYLSLEKIAKQEEIETEELKNIFTEYANSLTREEVETGHMFGFSLERLKMANIEVLNNYVRGYAKIDSEYSRYYPSKQEIQFIKSVPEICSEYYDNSKPNKEKNYHIMI